ncbi:hypothetical protein WA158_001992 [Blastocystis sp. Blastoise]
MYASGYYSLDSILEDEVIVPARFNVSVSSFGETDNDMLDEDFENDKIQEGQIREIPLWLAEPLRDINTVDILSPRCLSDRNLNQLQCNPSSMNLRSKCPHFYGLGKTMARFNRDSELCKLLKRTFTDRFGNIFNESLSNGNKDVSILLNTLTNSEQYLFKKGLKEAAKYLAMKQRRLNKISVEMVLNRKCKTITMT